MSDKKVSKNSVSAQSRLSTARSSFRARRNTLIKKAVSPIKGVYSSLNNYQKLRKGLSEWVDSDDTTCVKIKREVESRVLKCFRGSEKTLDFSRMDLKSIPPLQELSHLSELDLSGNDLSASYEKTEQDYFSGLVELNKLDLSFTNLKGVNHLKLDGLKNLEQLILSWNPLETLSLLPKLSQLSRLKRINLSNSQLVDIKDLDVSNCPKLEEVDLSNNHIKDVMALNFIGSPNITIIYLQNNEIEDIEGLYLYHAIRLKELDLNRNKLKIVDGLDLSNCLQLVKLWISENKLVEFNAILPEPSHPDLFIDLSDNNFNIIYAKNFVEQESRFDYKGPHFQVLEPNFSDSPEDLSHIQELVRLWKEDNTHPLWKRLSESNETGEKQAKFVFLATFLRKYLIQCPRSLQKGVVGSFPKPGVVSNIKHILETLESLDPCDKFLEKCGEIAEKSMGFDANALTLGALQMCLEANLALARKSDEASVTQAIKDLSWIKKIEKFLKDLNNLKILYNPMSKQFIETKKDHKVQKNSQDSPAQDDAEMASQLSRLSCRVVRIPDQVIDTINLLNIMCSNKILPMDSIDVQGDEELNTLAKLEMDRSAVDFLVKKYSNQEYNA